MELSNIPLGPQLQTPAPETKTMKHYLISAHFVCASIVFLNGIHIFSHLTNFKCNCYHQLIHGDNAAGILLTTCIHLVPKIKEGWSYASTRRVSPQEAVVAAPGVYQKNLVYFRTQCFTSSVDQFCRNLINL
jgi:hypothetical protein